MKNFLALILAMALSIDIAFGLQITEVMYAPNQTVSNTDGEWIELYNNGTFPINLSDWTIDGYNFDDVIINPGQYIVIARELIDGTDEDLESFETVWGNGDGVWNSSDGNYLAIDGYFSLGEDDAINLSNGFESITTNYNSSLGANGNGKTLELNTNLYFEESLVCGGTPGAENSIVKNGYDNIEIEVTVNNIAPAIKAIEITPDDSTAEGIQIMPNINTNKVATIKAFVEDGNGVNDIKNVSAVVNGNYFELKFLGNTSAEAVYAGSFEMKPNDKAGIYNVTVFASDYGSTERLTATFEYLGIIATTLSSYSLNFGNLDPGTISETKNVILTNTGNTNIDVSLSARLEEISEELGVGSIETLLGNEWLGLNVQRGIQNINPGSEQIINFRLKTPKIIKAQKYRGAILVTAMAK